MTPEPELIVEARGALGLITLNRPQALNALTHGMVTAIDAALDRFAAEPGIRTVAIRGAGEKAFSAGGDIRKLTAEIEAGAHDVALTFWRDEYLLNHRIKTFAKPFVALVDGIVMGGGVGVSLHGSHVVAGERFVFAMPEVGIGFFPDVGATHMLPRLPGEVGCYLALTGLRLGAADAVLTGLARAHVPRAAFDALVDRLAGGTDPDTAILAHAHTPGLPALPARAALIDRCFHADSVAAVLARLDAEAARNEPHAAEIAAVIRTRSPTSLTIALEQMRRGRTLSFREAMATEFRIVSRLIRGHDFIEGVRAAIIDKDGQPRWRPATLAEVDAAVIDAHFAPLGPDELPLPPQGPKAGKERSP